MSTTGSRQQAMAAAFAYYDDEAGGYFKDLAAAVAVPTESQHAAGLPHMRRYLDGLMAPTLTPLGYECRVYDNPVEGAGPVLLASRVEDPSLPTMLCYGHGDVVMGMEGRWQNGRDPWRLSFEGEKVYGRGTADNKGQHLLHIAALRTVLETRGKLGFNHKLCIEMGEENGSRGFREVIQAHRADFAADAFFSSDGPRTVRERPNITLGNRGGCQFDLIVDLRDGGHHSGNWGGLLANPGIILAHAIASITDAKGRILIDAWRPPLPDWVRELVKDAKRDSGANAPEIDEDWGEPGLAPMEKVVGWNSFEVLAFTTGTPERPVNAIPPKAQARCALRFVVGTKAEDILPSLRRHLDARGFQNVEIRTPPGANPIRFGASRTDPNHPFVKWVRGALDRAAGAPCDVLPNSGGSNVTEIIGTELGIPYIWLPLSYTGCSQHAPDEHILKPLMREGLGHLTSIYWDLGDEQDGYRK
ncbi:MAG: M20/M25/M40 family metallo-hydrolase [Hyphomicrobiaceae bacterium]|nr:M20/M25/M40 family metallo-hydrolase [Hyphomicrobiaceae bacterium]